MVGEVEKAQEASACADGILDCFQVLSSLDGVDSPAVNSARGWNAFVAGKKHNAASGKTSIAFLEQ